MYEIDFVEFPSSSAADSSKFFATAFGWTAASYGPTYTDVQGGGVVSFGFQQDTAEQTTAPLVTIRTDDLERAKDSVEAAGGVVTAGPFSFPGGRRFHFREPGGAELAVWSPDS
ncbi:glyoxalase/bleomycin resistance/extradiol dioxygenase family protein [Amycolatopsis sp. WAC 04182]|uniref:VOC family protein n=1 Tax=Amycolatopsis sp. WAC 04182 TaxID=2203198 RepID=UPI000F779898|nr:VOC family protein [Amycolatopsis sp. WAC 04182]RSN65316.1 glyoxalase/bleomycin resistance/extradiol dioxygenase family protein [Amycolatopsis sp. WAC 04182]